MTQQGSKVLRGIREVIHRVIVIVGAAGLTLAFFLVLPLIQTLSKPPDADTMLQTVDAAVLDAPPPPPEEEMEEEEPEEEPEPPELTEEAPPLDLSQLELALNPGFGDGMLAGDFAVNLTNVVSNSNDVDELFSVADLDQKPRVIYQPGPRITPEVRRRSPGTVYIIFIVDQEGRVTSPQVQKSSDPALERPALEALRQWKFEPGKRGGQPVRFRMRVPFTFPEGL